MNNKGFAITGIIYGIMLLFILVLTTFLSVLIGNNRRIDALVEGVYETLEYPEIEVTYDTTTNLFSDSTNEHVYITSNRGLYKFSNHNNCRVYLPKNTVIITKTLRDQSGTLSDDEKTLYYLIANDSDGDGIIDIDTTDVEKYEKLDCLS